LNARTRLRRPLAACCLLAALLAPAAAPAVELGAAGGVFAPFDGNTGGSASAQIAFRPSDESAWRLGAEILFREFDTGIFGADDVDTESYQLAAFAHYTFREPGWTVHPYTGFYVSGAVNVIDADDVRRQTAVRSIDDVGGAFGVGSLLGADIPVGQLFSFFAEARVHYDLHIHDAPDGQREQENFGGVTGMAGVRWRF